MKTQIPGASYLVEIPHPIPEGDKCNHSTTRGQWMVKWEGKFYSIQPSTQMQKDIWLSAATKSIGDKAEKSLRWLCLDCGNIQLP